MLTYIIAACPLTWGRLAKRERRPKHVSTTLDDILVKLNSYYSTLASSGLSYVYTVRYKQHLSVCCLDKSNFGQLQFLLRYSCCQVFIEILYL